MNLGTHNSFFEPRTRDIAHPGSGSAQSLLRVNPVLIRVVHGLPFRDPMLHRLLKSVVQMRGTG